MGRQAFVALAVAVRFSRAALQGIWGAHARVLAGTYALALKYLQVTAVVTPARLYVTGRRVPWAWPSAWPLAAT